MDASPFHLHWWYTMSYFIHRLSCHKSLMVHMVLFLQSMVSLLLSRIWCPISFRMYDAVFHIQCMVTVLFILTFSVWCPISFTAYDYHVLFHLQSIWPYFIHSMKCPLHLWCMMSFSIHNVWLHILLTVCITVLGVLLNLQRMVNVLLHTQPMVFLSTTYVIFYFRCIWSYFIHSVKGP